MLRRPRITYANVVSSLALFIALGGASYAAIALPAASVGTRQLKNHAVTLVKISAGARSALRGQQGAPGSPGAPGTARAYGQVAADGTLTISKGNPSVTPLGAGRYCISIPGIDPSTARAEVTLGGAAVDPDAAAPAVFDGSGLTGACPVGTLSVELGKYTVSGSSVGFTGANEPFFFLIP
jgi:hypothetical protein